MYWDLKKLGMYIGKCSKECVIKVNKNTIFIDMYAILMSFIFCWIQKNLTDYHYYDTNLNNLLSKREKIILILNDDC